MTQKSWYCKLCVTKELPFFNINFVEFFHLLNETNTIQKNQINEPTTLFEKLNLFSDNEDTNYKYYYITEQFKENGLDKNSKNLYVAPTLKNFLFTLA